MKTQQTHTNMLCLQPSCWNIMSLRDKRWNLHRCSVSWTCSNHNVALGRPEDIQNVEGCKNSTKKQRNLKTSSLFEHPNRCSTFRKGSLRPSLPQAWNLNVPWDASKTGWNEKQNHPKTLSISIKFNQAASLGRSKGTTPGAKKTSWALLEGPRDPRGAQKLSLSCIINYHERTWSPPFQTHLVFENHQNTSEIYVLLCTLPSCTFRWGRQIRCRGPPFGPSNAMHTSPRTPPRAPRGQTHAPKSSQEAPPGPLRTSDDTWNEKDRQSKTCKICTFSVQGIWKAYLLYFSVAPGTSQDALPFGRTRPRVSERPLHTCPGESESPLGLKSIPKLRLFM